MPLKPIIPEGTKVRYIAYLWYIPETTVENLKTKNTNQK